MFLALTTVPCIFFDPLIAWDMALDAGSTSVPSCALSRWIPARKDGKKCIAFEMDSARAP
jgi:hypothetical protein